MKQRKAWKRQHGSRSGKVLALVAFGMVAILGAVGLVIDGGRLMAERRHAQNAADAAAMAAAIDLFNGNTVATATATAFSYASSNGYNNDGTTNTVTVNIPPSTGAYAGNSQFVEVTALRNVNTTFMRIFFSSAVSTRSRGVAGYGKAPASNRAVIALNLNKNKALSVKKANLIVDGPIAVNSRAKKAAVASDGADVVATSIKVVGTYEEKGGGDFAPNPTTGASITDDPLGLISPPSKVGMPNYGAASYSGGTRVLQPGLYSKIEITGSTIATFSPGIYYVEGGDVKLETSGSLTANGVMFYIADHAFSMKTTASYQMSGPTDGDYEGLSVFQNRSDTKGAKLELKDNDVDAVAGTIYIPNGQLEIKGKGTLSGAQLIANRIKINGDETINLTFDPSKAAKVIFISLVE